LLNSKALVIFIFKTKEDEMKRLFFSLSLVVMLTVCISLANSQVVKDGLFAYWTFDQATVKGTTISDTAGANNATINGAPKIVAGKVGEAIQFDGKADFVDLTILKGFGTKLAAFSVDFWLKTSSTADWTTLFKTLNDGASMGFGIDLNRTAKAGFVYTKGATQFFFRDSKGKQLPGETTIDIYNNTWHHIGWVITDAKTNTFVVYIDGKAQTVSYGDVQTPAEFIDFQYPLYLGNANNRGVKERYCPALVDELRFYTKALTAAQIQQNFAATSQPSAVNVVDKLPISWGNIKASR